MMGRWLIPAVLAALSGCAALAPARSKPSASTAKAAFRAPVTSAQRREIDRQYFEAVSAYMRGDAIQARVWIDRILDVDPHEADALALRARLDASSSRP